MKLLRRIKTSAYRLEINGLVERFHLSFKSFLIARMNQSCWLKHLSTFSPPGTTKKI